MNRTGKGRRRFLKNGLAMAGLAVGSSATAANPAPDRIDELHQYGERSRFVKSLRTGSINNPERRSENEPRIFGLKTPLQDLAGIVTPSSLHFVNSHGFEPPDIDPFEHRLVIHGLVDRPLIFTMEELKRLPAESRFHFIECHGNSNPSGVFGTVRLSPDATVQDTHGFTSCSEWTGVSLSLLLNEAGVQKNAGWILAEGADPNKHSKSIPLGKAMEDVIVAYAQNGEPVRPEQGFPLRLIVPGWQGINNVKWLRSLEAVDEPYMFNLESTKYPSLKLDGKSRWFENQMGPKSVITRPSGGQRLVGRGFYEISGLAWSGAGAIRRVEVSTDSGRTWTDAKLQGPVLSKAHARFSLPWTWNGDETTLLSRCTDEEGVIQPSLVEVAELWGTDVEYFRKITLTLANFNAIQPWKVQRDGSIRNALY
jgi:sulfane dehydrogenase subunit SoxC